MASASNEAKNPDEGEMWRGISRLTSKICTKPGIILGVGSAAKR